MKIQAYNETSVRNLQLIQTAENLLENGDLTPPQYEQVKTEFPVPFKQPNIFIRLGLLLFTSLCVIFSISLITFITGTLDSSSSGWGILSIIFAVSLTTVNEYFIRERQWYRQGSDNALAYASIGCFVMGISMLTKADSLSSLALLSFVSISIATVRYGDPLLALAAFYALLISFFSLIDDGQLPLILMSVAGAGLSILIYFFAQMASKRDDLFYWSDCFVVLKWAALGVFYASINYYVVGTIFQKNYENGTPTSYNTLFAVLTAVVPLVYLAVGIKTKDRTLWIMGFLGIVASIMTYRHYHSIMPIEYTLTLAGLAFLVLAFVLIKYLKTPKNGFAYQPKRHRSNLIESLVVNQLLQNAATSSTPEQHVKFGGGDFDGGGAEGDI